MNVQVTIAGEKNMRKTVFLVMEGRDRVCVYDWQGGVFCRAIATHVLTSLFQNVDVDESVPLPACTWKDAWQEKLEKKSGGKVRCVLYSLLRVEPSMCSRTGEPRLQSFLTGFEERETFNRK